MSTFLTVTKTFVLVEIIISLSSCGGTEAAANEIFAVKEILTKGEEIQSDPPLLVEVSNCNGYPDHKSKTCTAGIENNVSFGFEIDDLSVKQFSVEPSVSNELGFNKSSSESITLDPPEAGFVYQYWVTITYQIITGEARVQSSDGTEKTVQYRYQASCSLTKSVPEIRSCQDALLSTPTSTTVLKFTEKTSITGLRWLMGRRGKVWDNAIYDIYVNNKLVDTLPRNGTTNVTVEPGMISVQVILRDNFIERLMNITPPTDPISFETFPGGVVSIEFGFKDVWSYNDPPIYLKIVSSSEP